SQVERRRTCRPKSGPHPQEICRQHRELHIHIYMQYRVVASIEHPPELLGRIFHILYEDLEIIDEATFLEWRENRRRPIGKGNAVLSLTDFSCGSRVPSGERY
ncbi:hypothetical protein GBAR_LOCUS8025, partial [Geodia barretti]